MFRVPVPALGPLTSDPSPTFKPLSTASSPRPTTMQNPSPGPPIQTKSSPLSAEGTKC